MGYTHTGCQGGGIGVGEEEARREEREHQHPDLRLAVVVWRPGGGPLVIAPRMGMGRCGSLGRVGGETGGPPPPDRGGEGVGRDREGGKGAGAVLSVIALGWWTGRSTIHGRAADWRWEAGRRRLTRGGGGEVGERTWAWAGGRTV
jgi:hypothetical protein